ncbi:Glutaredoxin [Halobacillus dabanensis]|uniref:Glutaredoxin n=1 Tax=Halobacillus dabanensis TaxID=240302 RepID=A0A1I3RBI1_HALDA|nr:glutaredoxin family protein [Halobacillus dabanensis]SFJ43668.1 Glutaredoxin [Halobacillus dabanensis]
MADVVLFSKKNCGLCDEVRELLSLFEVSIKELDIEKDPVLQEKYMLEIPVVKIGGEELDYRSIDYFELEKRLQ